MHKINTDTDTTINKEHFWIDHLRVIATLSVILVHVSGTPVIQFGIIDIRTWWIGNILDGSVRFCVPIFFMISGALLLSKDYSLPTFIKKRFFRLIPPLIFWSLVYITYDLARNYYLYGEIMNPQEIFKFISIKLYKGDIFHLWFVYAMIGLYLIIPIVRKWIKKATNDEILYFLLIWGITVCFNFPYLNSHKPTFELMYFSGYLGYMILGYFLSENNGKLLNSKWTVFSLFVVGNLITILGTYFLSKEINSFDTTLYVYLTPNVTFSSIGIFLFFKNLRIKSMIYSKLVNLISKNSYGIFLIHILVLSIIDKAGINWQMTTPFLSFIIVTFVCLFVSSIIILIMNKVKFLNKIAG